MDPREDTQVSHCDGITGTHRQRAQFAEFSAKTGALQLVPAEFAALCSQVQRTIAAALPPKV